MEIKALTIAGSVPGLHSYLPWRGQEKGEEAAAVICPLGIVWGFTFIFPKRRRAGKGSQGSKRKTRRKWVRIRMSMEKEPCKWPRGEGGNRQKEEALGTCLLSAFC